MQLALIGSIECLPSGRYRYRVTVDGRTDRSTYDTENEALAVQLEVSRRARNPNPETLGTFAPRYLDHRETVLKRRDVRNDRSRWRTHVEGTPMANTPLRELKQRDIEAWADDLSGAVRTRKRALCLVRGALARAKRERLIPDNPAVGVAVEGTVEDRWTYLDSAEQARMMGSDLVPFDGRTMIAFAVGAGLRQGEQWALELRDVHVGDGDLDPHVIVRWGSRGKPTKTGKVRRVDLVPWLVPIVRAWIAALPEYLRSPSGKKAYANEHGLLFPTARGCYHCDKKPPRQWSKWLEKLDIRGATGGPVVWHSLRHTCASMLASGAWGRRWTLQEIAAQLGHASTSTTERYAHLVAGTTTRAARETVPRSCHALSDLSRATQDSNLRPSVPESAGEGQEDREVWVRMAPSVARRAGDALRMLAEGDGRGVAAAVDVCERVLSEASLAPRQAVATAR